MTQYDCSYQNLAPSGCTEYYFGDTTGTISSYNFNSGNGYNLANQNHKICIRSEGKNTILFFHFKNLHLTLGVKVRNLKMDSNTGVTWCRVGQ